MTTADVRFWALTACAWVACGWVTYLILDSHR